MTLSWFFDRKDVSTYTMENTLTTHARHDMICAQISPLYVSNALASCSCFITSMASASSVSTVETDVGQRQFRLILTVAYELIACASCVACER